MIDFKTLKTEVELHSNEKLKKMHIGFEHMNLRKYIYIKAIF